jgi:hypothetical protein
MLINKKVLITLTSLVAFGAILYITRKNRVEKERERILDLVADEGYETAYDIISPISRYSRSYKMR